MMHALTEANRALLMQVIELLNQLDDDRYREVIHRVGGHLRHILEFYECFLDGAGKGYVDYDRRKRDRAVETERAAAKAKAADLLRCLDIRHDGRMWVRMEDSCGDLDNDWMLSSISRELQYLRSHTVHHFALIAPGLAELGVHLSQQFGVAPSTLRYRASLTESPLCAQ